MKKSDYTRLTRECRFEEFKPAFFEYLQKYIQNNGLKEYKMEALACFETTNHKKGFLGKVKTSYTEICITERFLFWATIDEKKETGMAAAQWNEISEIREWEDTEMGKLFEETGLELFGFTYKSSKRGSWFIGIENNEAGRKCKELMKSMTLSIK